ncbi:hypothetical protein M4914_07790 [Streptomyces somaliensis DSM 40738]|uniref:Uncharacterized protein n=1 Tax=Streptomyces somaliensis (strain ATCC 33201 / DSM 40738 / JCM 12659 / KCTC 9044 / NCTC 11332 / NRRL B-12077 / IP 733) TaxID=1134445 RepID=A0AA44DD36_STRE0|nr:hypothetical protein [Streptomyces somaliensis]MCQ0022862.1 hypothetical protein [Streptomyces somaliensis DSM 40738]NKY14037.1 hypothetical protein [Streptomyces somaliensis DSM 40738]
MNHEPAPPSSPSHVRLLPWNGPEGNPALLVTDGTASRLSLLADAVEARQTETAATVLRLSRALLEAETPATADEYHFITRRLAECLTDALRICESRARRIPPYVDGE